MKKLMLLGVFLLSMLSAAAYDFEVDGLYYNLLSTAEMTCEVTNGTERYVGNVLIPSTVSYKNRELSVTSIGNGAFSGCSGLTSVVIPNSVTEIGRSAFSDCSGLTSVVIPNSVTEIGSGVFSGCSGLTSVVIPNSVTEIGSGVFSGCSGLTSVVIPNSVTALGWWVFNGCSSLTSVIISNSVTDIGDYAFSECSSLTSVIIPNSVTDIGNYAFSGCSSLTSVVIPNSVTTIWAYAFSDCSSLTSVVIPSSVTEIDVLAFSECKNLKEVTFECSPSTLTLWYIEDSSKEDTFRGCALLTNLLIGRPLELRGRNHHYNIWEYLYKAIPLSQITHLTILDGVDLLNFFENNERLKEQLTTIKLGKNITEFGHYQERSYLANSSFVSYSKLDTIICEDAIPTPCYATFSNSQYTNIKIYVPKGSLAAYQNAEGWKNFWDIIEMGESGTDSVTSDSEVTEIGRYNLQGRKVTDNYNGVVIVKYSDGTAKKIISRNGNAE